MTQLDPRDAVLQSLTPAVMVPLFGQLDRLDKSGHRFLVAKDGMWVEACRPGIYSRQQIAEQKVVAMPFGSVTSCVELACGQIPGKEIHKFIDYARRQMPNEVAMAMVWDDSSKTMESVILEPISSSPGHIKYKRPELSATQHVVVDIHSHGSSKAFFSRTDNEDDKADLKVAVVVGNLDTNQPTIKARLCTVGHYLALNLSL